MTNDQGRVLNYFENPPLTCYFLVELRIRLELLTPSMRTVAAPVDYVRRGVTTKPGCSVFGTDRTPNAVC
jgi:hypothetical protein